MPITNLTVENFKAFGDRNEVPMAPITLIYGPNSGGKSSLIQALMLLKQSVEGHGDRFSGLIPSGRYVDLGTFRSLTHGHDRRRTVKFEIGYKGDIEASVGGRTRNRFPPPEDTRRAVSFEFRPAKSASGRMDGSSLSKVRYKSTQPHELDISLEKTGSTTVRGAARSSGSLSMYRFTDQESIKSFVRSRLESRNRSPAVSRRRAERMALQARIDEFENERDKLTKELSDTKRPVELRDQIRRRVNDLVQMIEQDQRKMNRIKAPPSRPPGEIEKDVERHTQALKGSSLLARGLLPERLYLSNRRERDDDTVRIFNLMNPVETLSSEIYTLLASLTYLGPLRSYPARHYPVSGSERFDVGLQGEFTSEILYHAERETLQKVNEWFSRFEIPYEISVAALGDRVTGELIALTLKDKDSGLSVGPSDVGFGIGQLLPIIVQGVVSHESGGAILCVEQPEIHLHPRLQAHIADLLIETIKPQAPDVTTRAPGINNQWIVETHSDVLMLRLQRRIREKTLSHEDVSVLYVAPIEGSGSTVVPLRLDMNGNFIDEWPDGFFEEGFNEMMTVSDR